MMKMKFKSIALTLGALLIGSVSTITLQASADSVPTEKGHRVWQQKIACKNEDGVNCFWNADSTGNGTGHSFFTVEMPGRKHMICVIYVRKEDNHWNYCS